MCHRPPTGRIVLGVHAESKAPAAGCLDALATRRAVPYLLGSGVERPSETTLAELIIGTVVFVAFLATVVVIFRSIFAPLAERTMKNRQDGVQND
jgi:hypothetical protein